MHWIQKDIFKRLALNDGLRYSELKPDSVEGNLFTYHLNQLINERYVNRQDKTYTLSEKGKTHVSSMSLEAGSRRKQPKIVVMFVAKNKKNQYLLFKWKRQPYRNLVSFPFGKIHYGSSVLDFSQKELKWKTGLEADLEYTGDIYAQTIEKDKVTDHFLAHIFNIDNVHGDLHSDKLVGEPFWGNPNDFKDEEFVPGFKEIIKIVEKKSPPYLEEITCIKAS